MKTSSDNSHGRLRKFLFAVISVVIFFVVAEGAARLGESYFAPETVTLPDQPGWQTTFFRSLFDWHEPDPTLLWRFKPNLDNRLIKTNSCGLIADELERPKPDGTYRIMIVGDSSPVGLGLKSRTETFADVLKRRLVAAFPATRLEIINAAVSGYSSEQIVRYMDADGWSWEPDVLVVYCGNNDASVSGAFSDRELIGHQHLTSLRRLLAHTALYRLMRCFLASQPNQRDEGGEAPLQVRVSPEEYGENIATLAACAGDRDCPLVLLQPPVPLLWPAGLQFRVFRHVADSAGELLLPDRMTQILGRGIKYCLAPQRLIHDSARIDVFTLGVYQSAFVDSLPPNEAVDFWQRRATEDGADPVPMNNYGVSCWASGQFDRADSIFHLARERCATVHADDPAPRRIVAAAPLLYNTGINLLDRDGIPAAATIDSTMSAWPFLDSALQADYFSLRIKRSYTDQLTRFYDADGIAVVNLADLFRSHGGERLFVDHCHPTAEGHRLVAETLFTLIASYVK